MLGNVLTLREHETAEIGDRWSPEERILPDRVAAALEGLQSRGRIRPFEFSRRSMKARNYVGTVSVDGCSIDVLPKIDQAEGEARTNLLSMLQIAGLVPHFDAGSASLTANVSLVEILLRTYVERLSIEWRRGHIAGFFRVERNRSHLRGKLLIGTHLRRNLHRPWHLHTGADEFIEDIPLSRLLKLALRVCHANASLDRTRRYARQLLGEFDGVANSDPAHAEIDRLAADRQTARFASLIELAKMVARGQVPDRPGARQTYSILFDMNVVFERLVGNLLRGHACPQHLRVQLQVGNRALLRRHAAGQFWLRPDVGVFRGQSAVCLVDTKWKILDAEMPYEGVSQSDMYQMYAYGKEYGCPFVVLLYPRTAALQGEVATYHHNPGDLTSPSILIRTVDVGARPLVDSEHRPSIRSQLKELLSSVTGPEIKQ